MNRNTEYDVVRGTEKIVNQAKQLVEIRTKADKLLQQTNLLEVAIRKESERILRLGEKQPRRDGKPETPEAVLLKKKYNSDIYQEKLNLVRRICIEKNIWDKIENLLPDAYKDTNLNQ